MKKVLCFLALLAISCQSAESIECWFVTPTEEDVVSGTFEVQIGYSGPASNFQLLVNEEVVVDADDSVASENVATLSWNTADVSDGTVEISAVVSGSETSTTSEPIQITIDNTEPVVSIDLERFSFLTDQVTIPLTVEESNLTSVRLLANEEELLSSSESVSEYIWDTTTFESRAYRLSLEATDIAGNIVTDEISVIVGNNGHLLTGSEIQYIPSGWVSVPDPFDPKAEFHTRISASMTAGGNDPGQIIRAITWLTWDTSEGDWTMDYSLGQGFCPHRGTQYHHEMSDSGEIILEMSWTEVPEALKTEALEHLAKGQTHPDDAIEFPFNNDPATLGAFFGHIAPVDPETHAGESILVEVGYAFIYSSN